MLGSHISGHTGAFRRLQRPACGGRCMMISQESDSAEPGGAKSAYGDAQQLLAQQGLQQRLQGATGQRDGHANGLRSTQFDEVVIGIMN